MLAHTKARSRAGRVAMHYVVEFVRTRDAENPYALISGRQEYLLSVHDGHFGSGSFEQIVIDWDEPLWSADLTGGPVTVDADTGRTERLSADEMQQRIGQKLRTLLDTAGWDRYDAAIDEAVRAGQPVYVTIRSAAAEMYTLPWELLTIQASGQNLFGIPGVFLAYAWPGAAVEERPAELDERVLMACSAAGGSIPAAKHLQPLKSTRASTGFDPLRDVVLHVSRSKLGAALVRMDDAGNPASVLHILCHGDERDGNFGLIFNGEAGQARDFVTASDLRRVLQPHVSSLRLVVLAACHGGDPGALGRHLGGVAQALHRIGIQWVIGSRYPLSVPGSNEFVRTFYGALLGDRASVEQAFADARRHLVVAGGPLDWLSMQLFVRPEHRGAAPVAAPGDSEQIPTTEPALGALWHVADEPLHYLPRPDVVTEIVGALTAEASPGSRPRKRGIHGMGGIGKSVVAAAVARDLAVRRRFVDGVYWLSIGHNPELAGLQGELARALGATVSFDRPSDGERQLSELLADKRALIILDDVWEPSHAAVFDIVGADGRVLITTRNLHVLSYHSAEVHRLDVLSMTEARRLLAGWTGADGLPPEADELALACGRLPVAVAMVGALLGGGIHSASRVLTLLATGRLKKIKGRLHEYDRYRNVYQVIDTSVDALKNDPNLDLDVDVGRCYADLAVFRDGAVIARSELLVLWSRHGLDDFDVDELCAMLAARALLQREPVSPGGSPGANPGANLDNRPAAEDDYIIRLHDLQRVYARACTSDMAVLHGQFVDAFHSRSSGRFGTGQYYFIHLGHHLIQAGRSGEMRALLSDYEWLDAKLRAVGPVEILADYERLASHEARAIEPGNQPGHKPDGAGAAVASALAIIADAVRLASHVLASEPAQLSSQLLGRLGHYPDERTNPERTDPETATIRALLQDVHRRAQAPWLVPVVPSLTAPGGPLVRTLEGIERGRAVAVTRDRHHAVATPCGTTPGVWDLREGRLLHELAGHIGWVNAVLVVLDGRLVVSGSDDRTIKVWELRTGALVRTLDGHQGPVRALAATGDDAYVVSASEDATVRMWNVQTGELVRTLTGHGAPINAVAATSDGALAVSASSDHEIKVWDLHAGEEVRTVRGLADVLCVSPDGACAVSASSDQVIEVWDLREGRLLRTLHGHWSSIRDLAMTPDGTRAVSASGDHMLKVWDVQSGREMRTLRGHSDEVYAVSLTPDGRYAISGSHDRTLKVWDLHATVAHSHAEAHGGAVNAVAVAGRGGFGGGDGGDVTPVAVTAASDRTLNVWDVGTGELVRTLGPHSQSLHAVAVTPDGALAVTAAYGDTLQIWDVASGRCVRVFHSHSIWVNAVAITPDGLRAITAGMSGTVKIWDVPTGELVRAYHGHTSRVDALAITPDGQWAVTGSRDQTVQVWAIATGAVRHTLRGESWFASDLRISADGRRLVTVSRRGVLRIWDLATGGLVHRLGRLPHVRALAITPDSRYAVLGARDRKVTVRDLASGNVACSFTAEQPILCCAIAGPMLAQDGAPASYRVIAGDDAGGVHILKLLL